MLNILYVSVIEQNSGWGAETFMNSTFQQLGHSTQPLDFRVNRNKIASRLLELNDCDVFFLQRGDYYPLLSVKAINRPKIFYYSELIARRRDADHLFESNIFDYYFVRSDECRNRLLSSRWIPEEKISILLSAYDPNTYYPISTATKDIDILFIGSETPRRKHLLNSLKLSHSIQVKSAFSAEANQLFNRAKIILNIHAEDYLDTETRVFEVLGSGGFLISELLSSESPFVNQKHLIEIDDIEAKLPDVIDYYLKNESLRAQIASAGHEFVKANHTYLYRTKEVVKIMNYLVAHHTSRSDCVNRKILRKLQMQEYVARINQKIKLPFRKIRNLLQII